MSNFSSPPFDTLQNQEDTQSDEYIPQGQGYLPLYPDLTDNEVVDEVALFNFVNYGLYNREKESLPSLPLANLSDYDSQLPDLTFLDHPTTTEVSVQTGNTDFADGQSTLEDISDYVRPPLPKVARRQEPPSRAPTPTMLYINRHLNNINPLLCIRNIKMSK